MSYTARHARSWLTEKGTLRVPEIGFTFWVIKGLSTAMGESTSDFLVHALSPVLAVLLGFAGFVVAMVLQFRMKRYVAWTYWLGVVMVGIFGTMAADVLHVGLGVPYTASTVFYAIVLIVVFAAWQRTEHTLSIHSIDTARREAFYWATVVATFAMGTALGDFTAYTLHLGYFPSAVIFAGVLAVPAAGYRWLRWNAIFSFWFAYVITRPFGAALADGLGKPRAVSGLGLGSGPVSVVLGAVIVAMVAYLAVTGADVQRSPVLEAERAR
ncbi:MAG: COG4705 family protein [Acidimicrobiales bacterium]